MRAGILLFVVVLNVVWMIVTASVAFAADTQAQVISTFDFLTKIQPWAIFGILILEAVIGYLPIPFNSTVEGLLKGLVKLLRMVWPGAPGNEQRLR